MIFLFFRILIIWLKRRRSKTFTFYFRRRCRQINVGFQRQTEIAEMRSRPILLMKCRRNRRQLNCRRMDPVDSSRLPQQRFNDVEGADDGEAQADEVGNDDDEDEQRSIDHLQFKQTLHQSDMSPL